MSEEMEGAARQLAERLGYRYGILTDGTIVLEPPPDCRQADCPLCHRGGK